MAQEGYTVGSGIGSLQDGKPPDETDNANYFCEYAFLYHQMDMLEDEHRTGSYFNAITWNPDSFKGKVVLDVGAGSGILSIFAAKAGAKEVFAVEATDMAVRSRKIVEAQGLSHIIKVVQGTVETVTLPYMVDVIISEWMGYFLLRESMLDSVLVARDRFLKPGGALFPSHATLFLAPVGSAKTCREKQETFEGERQHFDDFNDTMTKYYGTDFSCMRGEFLQEQRKYYLQTGMFVNLAPKQLAGMGSPVLEIDLLKITLDDLKEVEKPLTCSMRSVPWFVQKQEMSPYVDEQSHFSPEEDMKSQSSFLEHMTSAADFRVNIPPLEHLKISKDTQLDGFTGYFNVMFRGSAQNPTKQVVELTTAPCTGTATHWGQQLFGFYPPLCAKSGDVLDCKLHIKRQTKNHRLLHLEASFLLSSSEGKVREKREDAWYVD